MQQIQLCRACGGRGGQINGGGEMNGASKRLFHRSVVSAGRRSLPRGQVEGAAAASAGFSFRALIASAFCPPSYRSPPANANARRFSRCLCGVSRTAAEVSRSGALSGSRHYELHPAALEQKTAWTVPEVTR